MLEMMAMASLSSLSQLSPSVLPPVAATIVDLIVVLLPPRCWIGPTTCPARRPHIPPVVILRRLNSRLRLPSPLPLSPSPTLVPFSHRPSSSACAAPSSSIVALRVPLLHLPYPLLWSLRIRSLAAESSFPPVVASAAPCGCATPRRQPNLIVVFWGVGLNAPSLVVVCIIVLPPPCHLTHHRR